ncbi:MAG: I78 family peptidase inhibitor [Erythrobacter sp.]|jgi:hypothetical protein|nr:I78 family peptidase inhibitor [Erythrobacter sp.]
MPQLDTRLARFALCAATFLALAACGSTEEETTGNDADSFAARINGEGKSGAGALPAGEPQAPKIAQPLSNAAPGVYAPGTATDPRSETCSANRMGQFLGRPADDATRAAIMEAASEVREVRFIAPGSDYIEPDPSSPRLNIMIDVTGMIRDARCG